MFAPLFENGRAVDYSIPPCPTRYDPLNDARVPVTQDWADEAQLAMQEVYFARRIIQDLRRALAMRDAPKRETDKAPDIDRLFKASFPKF